MKQTVPGQDAEIVVNGTTIKRSTNSIADALQGVTLDLKTTTKAGEPQNPGDRYRQERQRRQD